MNPIDILITALTLAWKAYQFYRDKIDAVELEVFHARLNLAIGQLKAAKTPKEKGEANAKIITDVLDRL